MEADLVEILTPAMQKPYPTKLYIFFLPKNVKNIIKSLILYLVDGVYCLESHTWRSHDSSQSSCSGFAPKKMHKQETGSQFVIYLNSSLLKDSMTYKTLTSDGSEKLDFFSLFLQFSTQHSLIVCH